MACVYALSSSLDPDAVRYIGRSDKDDGKARLRGHREKARNGRRSRKHNWVQNVQTANGVIVSTVLESGLTYAESGVREMFYIAHYRALGFDLTNLTDGGEGTVGYVHSDEARAKLSVAKMGNTNCLGYKHSAEHRANNSAAQKGKTLSPEHCAKLSAARKGKPKSAEHRANIGAASKARIRTPHTDETRAKMSAAQKGRTRKPLSDEHRAKISATKRAQFAAKVASHEPKETDSE